MSARIAFALLVSLAGYAGAVHAQAWPTRVVKLVVPFPPGGGTDAIARIVAARLSQQWDQQMVVENKGGGATNIGTEMVARSAPDGYTMLLQSMPLAVNRFLFASLPYDPVADLAPVSLLCDYPNVMAVPVASPVRSVAEFIAYANANKGKVTFASSGNGTSVHLSGELFKRMAKIEMTHVPYRGAGPALNDLIPGRVDVMFNNIGAVLPLIQAGKLRALAVTTAKRTPPAVVAKANADTVAALAYPATKSRLEQLGVVVIGSSPEGLAAHLRSEMDKWGPIIREAGIKAGD